MGKTPPFLARDMACPACKAVHPQRVFRKRSYMIADKESDQHVTKYRWLNESTLRVHPPYYFLLYCPSCYFTDASEDFAKPSQCDNMKRVVKAFNEPQPEELRVIKLLGEHVNYETIDHESALNMHYLATFIQTMTPESHRDNYKAGRLFLRMAWLYREHDPNTGTGSPELQQAVDDSLKNLEQAVSPYLDSLRQLQGDWDTLRKALLGRIAQVDSEQGEANNPYRPIEESIEESLKAHVAEVIRLRNACRKEMTGQLSVQDDGSGGEFFSYPSYGMFLQDLREAWENAPIGEQASMLAAIEYFKQALREDAKFDSPEAQFSIVKLMVDLLCRCDDLNGAFSLVRNMYDAAMETRKECTEQLRQTDIDETSRSRANARLRRSNTSLEQCGDLRHELIDKLMARDMPLIKKILQAAANGKSSLEQIEAVLLKKGVYPEVVTRMKEPGGLLNPQKARAR